VLTFQITTLLWPACAYIRGKLPASQTLFSAQDLRYVCHHHAQELLAQGKAEGLRLDKFIASDWSAHKALMRFLNSISADDVLEIGFSGFIWTLIEAFPTMHLHGLCFQPNDFEDLQAVKKGGLFNLHATLSDWEFLSGYNSKGADVILCLNQLENVPAWEQYLIEMLRISQRFVVILHDKTAHKNGTSPDVNQLYAFFERSKVLQINVVPLANHELLIIRK